MTNKTKRTIKFCGWVGGILISIVSAICITSYSIGSYKTTIDNNISNVNEKMDSHLVSNKERFIYISKTLDSQNKDIKRLLQQVSRIEGLLQSVTASYTSLLNDAPPAASPEFRLESGYVD